MGKTAFLAVASLAALLLASLAQAQTAGPAQAERVSWQSVACFGVPFICNKLDAQGFLFSKPGQSKAVLISHGSQGIDSRMYDYVDSLQKEGFAALVIDHWAPRGIDVTHNDYAAASRKGGNEFNMASDSLTAAAWLRARGFEKVGSIGESQGGGAAVMMQQKFALALIERNARRLYANEVQLKPLDAVVGMYGYCGYRNAKRDAYAGTPFLFITGEVDNETPSRYCERHVGWMNGRGGNAAIVVIPGEGHSFDAPYKRQRSFGPHYANCDVLIDENGTTELNSGMQAPGEDANAMMAKCVSKGYHTGYWKDRFIAVPHWMGFFKKHL
ncbi:MAG TPA: dienelactone hydrolase family protein [Burkholderiaceae bacterium]|nr:dienelactone hydrolase family protein [Burkholderiaceae bacterium]